MVARHGPARRRRIVASLMLVAFLLPSALLSTTGRVSPTSDCPLGAVGNVPSVVAAMSDNMCGHAADNSCLVLACGAGAPAIRPVASTLVPSAELILFQPSAARQFLDLYRTGPPTPPPNQI